MNNKQTIFFSVIGTAFILVFAASLLQKVENTPALEQSVPSSNKADESANQPSLSLIKPVITNKASNIPTNSENHYMENMEKPLIVEHPIKATVNETIIDSADSTDVDAKRQVLAVRRIGLDKVEYLQKFAMNSNPVVRAAAVSRYRELEPEYETDNEIMRGPNESGRFVPEILQSLLAETDNTFGQTDSFAQEEALDYLGEFAGNGDPNVETAIRQLLQHPNLSTDTLSHAAELLIDNYNLPLDQVIEAIQSSPSTQILPKAELTYLQENLYKLNQGVISNSIEPTITQP